MPQELCDANTVSTGSVCAGRLGGNSTPVGRLAAHQPRTMRFRGETSGVIFKAILDATTLDKLGRWDVSFVCDNMVFRGDLIALNRKHTARLHLRTEINHAILRFQDHFDRLTGEIANLKENSLSESARRESCSVFLF